MSSAVRLFCTWESVRKKTFSKKVFSSFIPQAGVKGKLGRLLGVFEVSFHGFILLRQFIIHMYNNVCLQRYEMLK